MQHVEAGAEIEFLPHMLQRVAVYCIEVSEFTGKHREKKGTDSMKITLITVGKIKEKYLKDAIAEYSKRLSKYCKLDIIEVPDEKTPDQASETVEEGIRSKEGEKILRYIKDDMYVITLEIAGKMLTYRRTGRKNRKTGNSGKEQHCICDRWLHWPRERGVETLRLRT